MSGQKHFMLQKGNNMNNFTKEWFRRYAERVTGAKCKFIGYGYADEYGFYPHYSYEFFDGSKYQIIEVWMCPFENEPYGEW